MKFNKTAAFALCLMMLAVTGCSGKSDSESGSLQIQQVSIQLQ